VSGAAADVALEVFGAAAQVRQGGGVGQGAGHLVDNLLDELLDFLDADDLGPML
jgi:hypothetical protein